MEIENAISGIGSAAENLKNADKYISAIGAAIDTKGIGVSKFPRASWPKIISLYKEYGCKSVREISEYAESGSRYTNSKGGVSTLTALGAYLKDKNLSPSALYLDGNNIDLDCTEGLLRYGVSNRIGEICVKSNRCSGSALCSGFGCSIPARKISVNTGDADFGVTHNIDCQSISVDCINHSERNTVSVSRCPSIKEIKYSNQGTRGYLHLSARTLDDEFSKEQVAGEGIKVSALGNVSIHQAWGAPPIKELDISGNWVDPDCDIILTPGAQVHFHLEGEATPEKFANGKNKILGRALDGISCNIPNLRSSYEQYNTLEDSYNPLTAFRGKITKDITASRDDHWMTYSGFSIDISTALAATRIPKARLQDMRTVGSDSLSGVIEVPGGEIRYEHVGERMLNLRSASGSVVFRPTKDALERAYNNHGGTVGNFVTSFNWSVRLYAYILHNGIISYARGELSGDVLCGHGEITRFYSSGSNEPHYSWNGGWE